MTDTNTTAVAKRDTAALLRPNEEWYTPTSLKGAMEIARILSDSNLVPPSYKGRPENVVVALMFASSLGVNCLAALNNIAVINNKPTLYGDGLRAVVRAHPECEGIEDHFDEETMTATCIVKRRGEKPTVQTFSKEDAKLAGLWGKQGPWKNFPKRMLQWRAFGWAARDAFADALAGVIIAEEADDLPRTVEARVTNVGPDLGERLAAKARATRFIEPEAKKAEDPPAEDDEVVVDTGPEDDPEELATARKAFVALARKHGIEDGEGILAFVRETLGDHIESSADLCVNDYAELTDVLVQGGE